MNQCSNILTHESLDVSEHHTSTCCVLLSHISNSTGVLYISVLSTDCHVIASTRISPYFAKSTFTFIHHNLSGERDTILFYTRLHTLY